MTRPLSRGRTPLDALSIFVSTVGFTGYCPVASGTAGTLVSACLFWSLRGLSPGYHVGIALGILLLGTGVASRAEKLFGEKDSGKIVIDEMAGFWITMLFHPPSLAWIATGFALFRLFDVSKLFPADYAEQRFPGGLGVMLDDVVAGVYANGALHLVRWLLV